MAASNAVRIFESSSLSSPPTPCPSEFSVTYWDDMLQIIVTSTQIGASISKERVVAFKVAAHDCVQYYLPPL